MIQDLELDTAEPGASQASQPNESDLTKTSQTQTQALTQTQAGFELSVDYVDHADTGLRTSGVEAIITQTLARSRHALHLRDKKISLSVAVVSLEQIREVNASFRGKDEPTDVISVGDYSDDLDIENEGAVDITLGEVILCWDYIGKSAIIHSVSPHYEFGYVLSHGVLHLLGYEHGQEMFGLQDSVTTALSDSLTSEL